MLEGARVAVVVPAHDESLLIARTLRSIPYCVDHVVVVDDASSDDTVARARAVHDERIELLRHTVNRGVGAAITTGYRRAFEAGADVAAVMAGDGQMDPRDLIAVLSPAVRDEADYVKGDRLSHAEAFARMPFARWLGNHALSSLTSAATGLVIRDSQCGYTALRRSAADAIELESMWARYGYPNDLLSRLAVARLRVHEVTVRPVYGDERSGIRPQHLLTSFPYVIGLGLARRVRASLQRRGRPTRPSAPPRAERGVAPAMERTAFR
jgi:glycosyltransferase involved in cell wall biosynthesis